MNDHALTYTFKYHHLLGTLEVDIAVNPPGLIKQASSSIKLTCSASGIFTAPLSYQWNSTCSGNCFVIQATEFNITKMSLHSIDSGNHTCRVVDALGNSGSSTVQIVVKGN